MRTCARGRETLADGATGAQNLARAAPEPAAPEAVFLRELAAAREAKEAAKAKRLAEGDAAAVHARVGASRDPGVPKATLWVPSQEHAHVLASRMLSPASVDAVADAAILFVRTHAGHARGLSRAAPHRPDSLGSFSSLTNLSGLFQPMDF